MGQILTWGMQPCGCLQCLFVLGIAEGHHHPGLYCIQLQAHRVCTSSGYFCTTLYGTAALAFQVYTLWAAGMW